MEHSPTSLIRRYLTMKSIRKNRMIRFAAALLAMLLVVLSIPVSAADASQSEITSITLNKKCTDIAISVKLEKEYAKEHKN